MTTKELMIGDWVHYKMDLGKDGMYEKDIRIHNIYGNDVNCEVRGYEIISGRRGDNLFPIPITPEILGKNFGEARNGGYFDGDEFYELFIIEVTGSTWIIKRDNIEFSNIPRQQVMVSYVHELQHALRLCGIDKEIEL